MTNDTPRSKAPTAAGIQPTRQAGGCSNSNEDTDTLHLMPQAHFTMPNQSVQGRLHAAANFLCSPSLQVRRLRDNTRGTQPPPSPPRHQLHPTGIQGCREKHTVLRSFLASFPATFSTQQAAGATRAASKTARTPDHRITERCQLHPAQLHQPEDFTGCFHHARPCTAVTLPFKLTASQGRVQLLSGKGLPAWPAQVWARMPSLLVQRCIPSRPPPGQPPTSWQAEPSSGPG